MHALRRLSTIGVLIGALALAACGGDDTSEADESGFSSDAKAASQAIVEAHSQVPSARELTPLAKKPPSDISAVFIGCPVPQCAQATSIAEDAAGELGWDTRVIVSDFTPEAFASAFDSALQLGPDFLYYIAVQPESIVETQLQQAKDAGIKVIAGGTGLGVEIGGDSPIVAATSGPRTVTQYSELLADTVIADADSTEGIVFMYDPSAPSYVQGVEVFEKKITDAGGTVEQFKVNQTGAGDTLPGEVVSFLQSNPDTAYLVTPNDNMLIGVADAIAAAGLTPPKLIGQDPTEESFTKLADGSQFASVLVDNRGASWDAVDLMARLSIGEDIKEIQPLGEAMILTQDNVADAPSGLFEGGPDNYLDAWLVQ